MNTITEKRCTGCGCWFMTAPDAPAVCDGCKPQQPTIDIVEESHESDPS